MSEQSLFTQAQALHRAGQLAKAEPLYRRLLSQSPRHGAALHGLGSLLYQSGRFGEAVALLRSAAELAPGSAPTLGLLSAACAAAGDLDMAVQAAERAAHLKPDDAALRNLAGQLAQQGGHAARALGHLRAAVKLAPEEAEVQHNIAITLHTLGRLDESVGHYAHAARLQPENAQIYFNLALAQQARGGLAAAQDALQKCLTLEPGHVEALHKLAYLRKLHCDWEGVEAMMPAVENALRQHVAGQGAALVWPYVLNVLDVDIGLHDACAAYFSAQVLTRARQMARPFAHEPGERERLTIGYLSADFRAHAVGGLVYELFGFHNRDNVRVNAYSLLNTADEFQARVRADVDAFRDLTPMSPAEAAQVIYEDRPDILVDLTGYTEHARPEIMALRPAPLQVSWLGYLNTMQAPFIDYVLTDACVMTSADALRYSEAVVTLPGCFFPGSRLPVGATPQRADLGLDDNAFVYCSFNHTYKLDPALFACWMRILSQTDHTQLWLYAGGLEQIENRLRERVAAAGVDAGRVVFAPRVAIEQHTARLRCADLLLDAFHYNAGATAMAAAQVGLPMLACTGNHVLSRMTTSINEAVGLGQLNCKDAAQYEAVAIALAQDSGRFAALRQVAAQAFGSKLYSLPAFAANLEQAYLAMWDNYCAGKPPVSLQVGE